MSDKPPVQRLDVAAPGFDDTFESLLARGEEAGDAVTAAVTDIIKRVRRDGDPALIEYTGRFDRIEIARAGDLELEARHLDEALARISPDERDALEHAAARIRAYHEHQDQASWHYEEADGTRLGQRVTPLDRVGLYVPGGKAAYPSTVLMNAIPARVAGVGELIMTVPTPGGDTNDLVLAAARIAGVDRVFRIGGAQAVAALAWGTETVPRVDKIVGPGNIYVATAKRLVFGQVGIDMIAGPSEVVIVADDSVDPDWTAMDLFAQAEHDELAQSVLISADHGYLDRVADAIRRLLPEMERREIIEAALAGQGALIAVPDLDRAAELVNRIAPEHLELLMRNADSFMDRIRHAGAIFVGPWSAEAMGDYCAGPNHVLPTSGTARFSSPLGVYDFQKRSSVIACSEEGARAMSRTASVLARAESLTAHARSAEYRGGE
ncbi:MAG: histidinol dehydrogenase [Gammaproteobacteria bacterium]|nr:histidinol dehydrogenase [Gammaproteobacteria bacterium]